MSRKNTGIYRNYSVIFLMQPETKYVYIDISFANDMLRLLRNHWNGHCPASAGHFSMMNKNTVPVMYVWRIGNTTRSTAQVYLLKWREAFTAAGYAVFVNEKSVVDADPKHTHTREDKRLLKQICVADFLNRKHIEVVRCPDFGEMNKPAQQKFTTAPADEYLRFRATGATVNAFQRFCSEKDLTYNQGLMYLLEMAKGRPLLSADLQERLKHADKIIQQKDAKIAHLHQVLEQETNRKEYPKKYQRAQLRHRLLMEFYDSIPAPDEDAFETLSRCSWEQSKVIFPEQKEYVYPNEDCVIHLNLKHISYGKIQSVMFV